MTTSIEALLSTTRLDSYLGKTNNSLEAKLIRYNYNIEISNVFYSPLNLLEVSIRNTLHTAFSNYLNDQKWLANYKKHTILKRREASKIDEAINDLKKKNKPLEEGRIIAELNLGFWINLYDRPYMELHKSMIKRQFPLATNRQRNIHIIRTQLNEIRNLRNRVFHYEPVWHWNNLDEYFRNIKNYLLWMHNDLQLNSFKEAEESFTGLLKRQSNMLK